MEFKDMSIEELEARKAAIKEEFENLTEVEDLEARSSEVDSINEELEARKAVESKKAEMRAKVAQGEGKVIATPTSILEEERKMDITSMEYRNAWLKNLQGNALTEMEQRAYDQAGTNAIPTLVSDKFFEKLKKLAPMLSEITLMRVAGNLTFVSEGVRNVAGVHTENADVSAAADTTVKVVLGAFEFMKILKISKSAKMMSIDAFEGWLLQMLSGDMARAIDNYILNDATNGIAAITFTTGTNQIVDSAATGYTYKDIIDLIALLPAAYDADAKFLCHKSVLYGQIANICNTHGQPIFVTDPQTGLGRIMGFEVVVDDYVATSNKGLYFGKWTDIVGNLSEGPEIEKSLEAGFTSGSIVYRGYASFDSKPAKTDAIVRLVNA